MTNVVIGYRQCKSCRNAKRRAWTAQNPELIKAIRRREYEKNKEAYIARAAQWSDTNRDARKKINVTWRWKLRLEMISAYGGACTCCGETVAQFLVIDHINNDGYTKRAAGEQSGAALYRRLKFLGWPKDEYQLLCMNCNFAKGHFGECPHQAVARDFGHLRPDALKTLGIEEAA